MSIVGSLVTFGGAMSVLGTVTSAVLPVIAIVGGVLAGIAAIAVTMGAAVVGAAIAFWNLADPLRSLLPVAIATFTAIKNIGKAIAEGNFSGAASAAIDGMKQVFLRGTMAIIDMVRNTMERLPTFIDNVIERIGDAFAGVSTNVGRLFSEMVARPGFGSEG